MSVISEPTHVIARSKIGLPIRLGLSQIAATHDSRAISDKMMIGIVVAKNASKPRPNTMPMISGMSGISAGGIF